MATTKQTPLDRYIAALEQHDWSTTPGEDLHWLVVAELQRVLDPDGLVFNVFAPPSQQIRTGRLQ